jgi:PAS domain S-box-containing protein
MHPPKAVQRGGATAPRDGWPALFLAAFRQSRNAMVLLDERRRHVDMNGAYLRLLGRDRSELIGRPIFAFVVGEPLSGAEWYDAIDAGQFAGTTQIIRADETTVTVEWAASTAIATGRRLVLFVALGSGRARRSRVDGPRPDGPRELTPREREVVRLVALGHSGPEVAEELHIAHDTVRTHVRNAMERLGARSRAHLVAKAVGDGLVLG